MLRRHEIILLCTAWLFWLAMPSRVCAYPWMVRHEYTGCATCHTDPSGGSVLTAYGRAQSELLLSTWGASPEQGEASKFSDQLFGLVQVPEALTTQAWVRNGYIWNMVDGELVDHRFLQMRADVGAHVAIGAFRATVSLGYNQEEAAAYAQSAWITRADSAGNLVSREHWVGVALAEDAVLVRAGRIALPFGLRNLEHTSWVRSETRTDLNQQQQHGVAFAYTGERVRAEVMAIAGNLQQRPDATRDRGYAGYAELVLAPRYTLGVSSSVTHAARDVGSGLPITRQAHGVFARAAPLRSVALLAELDLLALTRSGTTNAGYTGFLQADIEPLRGVHAMLTGEVLSRPGTSESTHFGSWFSAAWFPVAHADLRLDTVLRTAAGTPTELTILTQFQLYL